MPDRGREDSPETTILWESANRRRALRSGYEDKKGSLEKEARVFEDQKEMLSQELQQVDTQCQAVQARLAELQAGYESSKADLSRSVREAQVCGSSTFATFTRSVDAFTSIEGRRKNAFELDRSQSVLAEEAAPTNRGFVTTRIGRISKPSRRHPSSNHSTNNSRAAGSRSQPGPCHRKPENRTPQNRLHRAARNTRAMERQVHRRQADIDVESFSDSSQSQDVDATNLDLHRIRRLSRATSPVDQSHDGSDDLTFEEPLRVPSYDTSLSKNNTIGSVPVAIDGEAPDPAFIQPTATVGHHQEQVDTLYTVDGDQIFLQGLSWCILLKQLCIGCRLNRNYQPWSTRKQASAMY
ncbi:uncharacterized protein PG998_014440 [Apiospora kogelbergensis]|uniref:uncharacterized protein n=1 Tax=Apiospora kogelbergensis TaxID=1337665 RepID=UPI00312CD9E2